MRDADTNNIVASDPDKPEIINYKHQKINPWPRPDGLRKYLITLTESSLRMMVYANQVAPGRAQIITNDQNSKQIK